jgi:hypothetical protein
MARSRALPLLAAALLGAVMLGARPRVLLALSRRISRRTSARLPKAASLLNGG